MKIGIGIDTGGTYTDAVVVDFESEEILSTAKALTTKEDLTIGILGAIDGLPSDQLQKAEIISLSTTLATNACVEDKGGRAKLVFFGGSEKTINDVGREYGLPSAKEIYLQESFTKFSGEMEREPDWDLFSHNIDHDFKEEFKEIDGLGIVEMNSVKNGGIVERKAKDLFLQKHNIPVVCGHELFNVLNSLQRGSSTLLNASLFPVIAEFIGAIKKAMEKRSIKATIVIVRSDGSLMSEEVAFVRPVDTLLCGPTASVMGSVYFTKEDNSVVIDMGGTTTDMAIINKGIPHKVPNGIKIGKWRTFVDGLYIRTFGLGGDTAIHYKDRKMFLEDYRVVPLCVAAGKYPVIINNLQSLLRTAHAHTEYLYEHFILVKDIEDLTKYTKARYTQEEKDFCTGLKDGPLTLKEAASKVPGKDIYNLDVSRLLKEGIVQKCGLTPTDIMHLKGDFNRFPKEASYLGALYIAANLNISVDELCLQVYDEIKRKLYVNIVKVLLENQDSHYMSNGFGDDIEKFINDAYFMAKNNYEFLAQTFTTNFVLTGVGAPIHIFLEDVAKYLGTKAVFPKHYEVANALGAIVGNVHASAFVEIRPVSHVSGKGGYMVFAASDAKIFKKIKDAEKFAEEEAKKSARQEAIKRGAQGDITVTCKIETQEVEAGDGSTVYLASKVVADAVGSV